MKKRNSLIELYRFLFALNVVKNHGFFPVHIPYFSPGRISVEFFFMLSGYLLIRSIDKLTDMPLHKGWPTFIWNKVKALGVPLLIGIAFNIIYSVQTNEFNIWHYLWYVEDMLIVFTIYFILRKLLKNSPMFWGLVVFVATTFTILRFTPTFTSWGTFRAFSGISVGMLLSKIPKLNIKKRWVLLMLIPVWAGVIYIWGFNVNLVTEPILNLVLYPALIYLTFNLEFNCKVLNYLGGLSFGLYAFQSVSDVLRTASVTNLWVLFGVIVGLTILEDLVKRVIKHYISTKKNKTLVV